MFVAHLAGKFYRHIINVQGNFSTQMSISGESCSTGKSLMQTVCMLIFEGEVKSATTSMTESDFFETLDGGNNIYGKLNYLGFVLESTFHNVGLSGVHIHART